LFGDAEPAVVASAVLACSHWRLGSTASIVALGAHADAGVRRAVAVCLGTREDESAVAALIVLSGDPDRDVRDWASFGLASMSDADTEALRAALTVRLDDDDAEVRGEAMVGLARRRVRAVIPAVLKDLQGSGTALAIEAAGELADPVFVPDLERLFVADPENEELAEALDRCREAMPS
jgi:HEAT repeat protein